MRKLVRVTLTPLAPANPANTGAGSDGLLWVLSARTGSTANTGYTGYAGSAVGAARPYTLTVRAGAMTGAPGVAGPRGGPLDEHLAVDADRCRDRWALDCADVLLAAHPRPPAAALRILAELRAAHPGCRLTAAALTGGGWAVAGGPDPRVVTLPCPKNPRRSLLPSCLHAWLVAGGTLGEVEARRSHPMAIGHGNRRPRGPLPPPYNRV
ncbi:hypothetical protein [Streptomyces yaizuensis]|uniref:Uncharacterized protein n=1 Tax=Streptomyces yaizuensis TaxID=2989713 RepID=A0ABQ5P3I2_9ACTN|nr:hypothetical protein [Streptomyces sp. YSPA8]GLF97072.1 hypothetical protein SYYSPA8_22265 [Streptomyces sp. YSPA8]